MQVSNDRVSHSQLQMINTMVHRSNNHVVQSQEEAGSEGLQQVVIDPATGQPVPMETYDERSMHVDQTQAVGHVPGPNIIQNREDFEGVDAEPRSHDFQTHQVFGDITQAHTNANRSVMASSPI